MKTITLQLGNTDNKLTQQEWAEFVRRMRGVIESHEVTIHFFGAPPNWEPWQNVAWVLDCEEGILPDLKAAIRELRSGFRQKSVAWTEGVTEFI